MFAVKMQALFTKEKKMGENYQICQKCVCCACWTHTLLVNYPTDIIPMYTPRDTYTLGLQVLAGLGFGINLRSRCLRAYISSGYMSGGMCSRGKTKELLPQGILT